MTHDYVLPTSRALQASPWVFSRAHDGHLVPGFALESFGVEARHAIPYPGAPRPARGPDAFDLVPALPCTPWEFQLSDAARMAAGNWGQFSQVGLGKTITALCAYAYLKSVGAVDGMLVLGPESARHAWVGAGSDGENLGISGELVGAGREIPTTGLVFCSYDKVYRQPYNARLGQILRRGRHVLCMDEAHYITGAQSKRFTSIDVWATVVPHLWALTGTPVRNYPDKLWTIWRLLTRNACTLAQWNTWFRRAGRGEWNQKRLAELGRYLRRVSVVRTRREVAPHLPATTIRTITVPLEGQQLQAYHEAVQQLWTAYDWREQMMVLQGLCSHPGLLEDGPLTHATPKLEALREILAGLGDIKACIWSWRPRVLEWLASVLPQKSVQYRGATPPAERERAIHEFNHGDAQLFLGNPMAAGAGLNLPAGDVRIYWDVGWSPTEYEQSAGRIERGLNYGPKTEYRLVAADTIEAYIWDRLEAKENLQQVILQGERSPVAARHCQGIQQRWNRKTTR